MAKKEDLIKAYSSVTNTISLSQFDQKTARTLLRNGMRNYSNSHGLGFTDDEIDQAIISIATKPIEGFCYKSSDISKHDLLTQAFENAARCIISGEYADYTLLAIENSMRTFSDKNNCAFTDEEIHEVATKRLKTLETIDKEDKHNHYHMASMLEQAYGIAIHSVTPGVYDNITKKAVIGSMKYYYVRNGFTPDEKVITKYVLDRFEEIRKMKAYREI